MKIFCLITITILFFATGCIPIPAAETTATIQPSPTIYFSSGLTQEPQSTEPSAATLRIWLPPQFNPDGDEPASKLLKERLEEFSARKGGVRIEVRIKAENGVGGVMDSLSTANAAAPLALPDLVLLPRAHLETAALKGLLYPYDEFIASLEAEDWYPYAQNMAYLQNSIFGLPFAGDALVLLFRPAKINQPPKDWGETQSITGPMVFPAGDSQALYSLLQYIAVGGNSQDSEGRPILEEQPLTEVLTYYSSAEVRGLMPFWLTQFSSDAQSWEAYTDARADLAITWISRYLHSFPADTAASSVPTQDGEPFTLADGWVWALASPLIERRLLSVELAEFLTTGDFLSNWTASAGYLPVRSSALAGWSDQTQQMLINQIANSAALLPPNDVLVALSPVLQKATLDVLKKQTDPVSAAIDAVQSLTNP